MSACAPLPLAATLAADGTVSCPQSGTTSEAPTLNTSTPRRTCIDGGFPLHWRLKRVNTEWSLAVLFFLMSVRRRFTACVYHSAAAWASKRDQKHPGILIPSWFPSSWMVLSLLRLSKYFSVFLFFSSNVCDKCLFSLLSSDWDGEKVPWQRIPCLFHS